MWLMSFWYVATATKKLTHLINLIYKTCLYLLVNLFGNTGLEDAHKSERLRNIGVISKIVLGNELEGEWARDIGGMTTVRIEAYPL